MKCQRFSELIYDYIDGLLNDGDTVEFEKHLKNCPECNRLLNETKEANKFLQDNYEQAVSDSFRKTLMQQIAAQEKCQVGIWQKVKASLNGGKKLYLVSVAAVIIIFFSIGVYSNFNGFNGMSKNSVATRNKLADQKAISKEPLQEKSAIGIDQVAGSNSKANGTQYDSTYNTTAEKVPVPNEKKENLSSFSAPTERKVIKNQNISLEVRDFNKADTDLMQMIERYKGYIENSNTNTLNQKRGNYVIRVPAENLSALAGEVSKLGRVINVQINGQDVTEEFRDNEARLKALQKQEERLTALLGKAQNLYDVLSLEKEMERIRQEIEILQGRIQHMDAQVSFASLSLDITEVKDRAKIEANSWQGMIKQARNAFVNSVNGILVFARGTVIFFGAALPYIAIIALFFGVFWYINNKRKKEK